MKEEAGRRATGGCEWSPTNRRSRATHGGWGPDSSGPGAAAGQQLTTLYGAVHIRICVNMLPPLHAGMIRVVATLHAPQGFRPLRA